MLNIPSEIIASYDSLLIQRSFPKHQWGNYKKWLRFYFDFCHKYDFNAQLLTSLPAFIEKLRSKRQSELFCSETKQAVELYYELQLGLKNTVEQSVRGIDQFKTKNAVQVEELSTFFQTESLQLQAGNQYINKPGSIINNEHSVVINSVASGVTETHVEYSDAKKTQGANWVPVYKGLDAEIKLRHYSPNTLSTYRSWVRKFQAFVKSKDADLLVQHDVKGFLTDLAVNKKVAASTQNQAFNALLFLFKHVLKRDFGEFNDIPRAKRKQYIPVVMSRREVDVVLEQLSGSYILPAKLLYGCGLRISECLNLRLQDFNLDDGILTIHNGKGKKDRTVPLPQSIMHEIRYQIDLVSVLYETDLALEECTGVFLPDSLGLKYKNAGKEFSWQWFFPAKKLTFLTETKEYKRYHLHDTQLQKAIRSAAKSAKLLKRVTAHTFRHSFASHLLLAHYDIRTIQVLMGHSDVKTTMIYLQTVPSLTVKEAKSPLDF